VPFDFEGTQTSCFEDGQLKYEPCDSEKVLSTEISAIQPQSLFYLPTGMSVCTHLSNDSTTFAKPTSFWFDTSSTQFQP